MRRGISRHWLLGGASVFAGLSVCITLASGPSLAENPDVVNSSTESKPRTDQFGTPGAQVASSSDGKDAAAYEERIHQLEERLADLERRLVKLSGSEAALPSIGTTLPTVMPQGSALPALYAAVPKSSPTPTWTAPAALSTAAPVLQRPSAGPAHPSADAVSRAPSAGIPDSQASASTAEQAADTGAEYEADAPNPGLAEQQDQDELNQLLLLRDNVVTLKKGQKEVTVSGVYLRDNNLLQQDVAGIGAAGFRIGVGNRAELGVSGNYYWARRTTQLVGDVLNVPLQDFGDVSGQLNYQVVNEKGSVPGIVLTALASYPTGESPYTELFGGARSPLDPNKLSLSAGHATVGGAVQFYKSVDPISLFWGGGVKHYFPEKHFGKEIEPSLLYTFNAGLGFSVSPSTSLGIGVQGAFQDLLVYDGEDVLGFQQLPLSATFRAVQRLGEGHYLIPSFTFGLTSDTADATFGAEYRRRFK